MDRQTANVLHSKIWAIAIVILAIIMSFVWANTVNHGNDDKVKIVEIQAKGNK